MSLFPAYAEEAQKPQEPEPVKDDPAWLENSSFNKELLVGAEKAAPVAEKTERDKPKTPKRTKRKYKDSKHESPDRKKVDEDDKCFTIELKGHREYLNVRTIHRPSAPKYKTKFKINNYQRSFHKKRFKRYHQFLVTKGTNEQEAQKSSNATDENFTGFKQEEELSRKTANFNQHLAQHPDDVETWLDYVRFQDTVYQFEKSYRKGSMAKAQRVLAERKISILDKALVTNPNSEVLHREHLNVAVCTFPADELQIHLRNLLEKDKANITLWQGYIEATQCSMSHCNTPSVIRLYTKCLSTLHQLRRANVLERYALEENILKMLYQCGLFLKQAGLFEQLWTLLRMYLELNLSPNDKKKFNISSGFNEKYLLELEEVIFTSQLPLHELWLRVEKLRESCHWLPYVGDGHCEDPQRLVFTEDVAELIHPITTPENIFKLAATTFALLKIPLMPCRHTTMQELGLDYVPWNLDSVEPLMALYLPSYPVDISSNFLNDGRLSVGPQYLKYLPGQEEYLQFVLLVMKNCTECLAGDDQIAVTIWYFRFQRLLVILNRLQRFNMSNDFKKEVKKNIKAFLKCEENRQNVLYYVEYALLENELGNWERCIEVLMTTLKFTEISNIRVKELTKTHENRCHVYRTLIELNIMKGTEESEIIKLLCELVLCKKVSTKPEIVEEAFLRYQLITQELLEQDVRKLKTLHHFFPNILTDWIICTGWFIYLKEGIEAFITFLDDTLSKLNELNKDPLWQKEVLSEFYAAVLYKHTSGKRASGFHQTLEKLLFKSIETYPNNLFLLAVLEKEQKLIYSVGPSWWKLQHLLVKSGRALSALFAVTIQYQQIAFFEGAINPITGEKYDTSVSSKNRMLALFKKITSPEANTRRCGLIWRLYLQFVYSYFSSEECKNIYYSAVEQCPWLKALYIDAAIYIPAELGKIQDLIIEKELRLHVTPEELDILRS